MNAEHRFFLLPRVTGKNRKKRRLYRQAYLAQYGPGRVHYPHQMATSGW